jgi:hypothetical protein
MIQHNAAYIHRVRRELYDKQMNAILVKIGYFNVHKTSS